MRTVVMGNCCFAIPSILNLCTVCRLCLLRRQIPGRLRSPGRTLEAIRSPTCTWCTTRSISSLRGSCSSRENPMRMTSRNLGRLRLGNRLIRLEASQHPPAGRHHPAGRHPQAGRHPPAGRHPQAGQPQRKRKRGVLQNLPSLLWRAKND